jgi:hypothetical protein
MPDVDSGERNIRITRMKYGLPEEAFLMPGRKIRNG